MVMTATMFGSNDIVAARAFYDTLLPIVGLQPLFEHGSGGRIYGTPAGQPLFSIVRPFDGGPATAGNGSMFSIMCDSDAQVSALHAKTLELGGTCEGPPGLAPAVALPHLLPISEIWTAIRFAPFTSSLYRSPASDPAVVPAAAGWRE